MGGLLHRVGALWVGYPIGLVLYGWASPLGWYSMGGLVHRAGTLWVGFPIGLVLYGWASP